MGVGVGGSLTRILGRATFSHFCDDTFELLTLVVSPRATFFFIAACRGQPSMAPNSSDPRVTSDQSNLGWVGTDASVRISIPLRLVFYQCV